MTIDVVEENKQMKLVEEGIAAEKLLAAEAFNSTVNQLVDVAFQSFVNSKPEETEVREKSYHHYRALVDIVGTLQQRVQVKTEIEASENADDNNQEE